MMRSATAFLPDSMITFMNLDRSTEPNFGSGRMSRLGTSRRRGISLFLLLQLARASRPLPRAPPSSGVAHLLDQAGLPDRFVRGPQAFFGRFAPYFERDC